MKVQLTERVRLSGEKGYKSEIIYLIGYFITNQNLMSYRGVFEHHHGGKDHDDVEEFLHQFEQTSMEERKALGRVYRQELVKRSALKRIAVAWLITVPASALMVAVLFFTPRGMMLP